MSRLKSFPLFTDLFNMRGSDIEYNPIFFAYAVVTTESVQ